MVCQGMHVCEVSHGVFVCVCARARVCVCVEYQDMHACEEYLATCVWYAKVCVFAAPASQVCPGQAGQLGPVGLIAMSSARTARALKRSLSETEAVKEN